MLEALFGALEARGEVEDRRAFLLGDDAAGASSAKAAASSAMVTTISATASAMACLLISLARTRGKTIDILGIGNGILAGLVGITAGCDITLQ